MTSVFVPSILNEGTVVGTRLENCVTWYQNIVYRIKNNIVDIALIDGYIRSLIMPGMVMALKLTNEYFEYIFEGTVLNINLEYPSFITLQITKTDELINSREFPRFDIYIPSYIKSSWSEASYFSILTNLSLTGTAFRSKGHFDCGEECTAAIFLANNSHVKVKGKIVRISTKTPAWDYSIHFTDMVEDSSNLIYSYFMCLDEKAKQLQADFFKNIKKYL
jgi:hypothetical protein